MPKEFKSTFPDDPDYYEDEDKNNKTKKNVLDDTFDDDIKSQVTQPTSEELVKANVDAGHDNDVVLWRATTGARVSDMKTHGCASGVVKNAGAGKPTEAQRKQQISKGGVIPEFTTSTGLSGFSFLHWVVVVKINTKYLAKGSGTENGWVCLPGAPVQLLETVDRTLGFPEEAGWNGS